MKNETKNEMNETEQQLKLKEVAATEYMHQYLIEAQENNVLRAQARHSMRLGTIELDIIPTDKSQSLEDVMKQFSAFAKLMQKLHGNTHLTLESLVAGGPNSGAGEMHQ